jgi:transposase
MPMALKLRELTAEEQDAIKKFARSRTAPARLVERAKMISLAARGDTVPAIADRLKLNQVTVRTRLKRFNSDGLAGLNDRQRSGRPTTFTPEEVAEVVAASLTDPQALSLPFGSWTMDRLAAYLREHKRLAISRSRISELLIAEGLRWRSQETWFGERVDPEFAEKRGASRPCTPRRLRVVGS